VAAARWLDLITPGQLKPVLITAFAAYFGGLIVNHLEIRHARIRQMREAYRRHPGAMRYDVMCEAGGLRWRRPNVEVYYDWKAITAVEELAPFVVLWVGPSPAVSIPRRVFARPSDCEAFVAQIRGLADQRRNQ
jgi:hypothetical protein